MTIIELAQRDLGKAHRAHTNACAKPNVPAEELARTLELVILRQQILEIVRRVDSAGYRKQSELSPCDVCLFNPPSSIGGKPCTVCPAQKKGGAE